jgi:hypothetical protein
VTAAIFAYFLWLNASFYYWQGGWSYGPRHLAPGVAALCAGLPLAWDRATSKLRIALFVLAVLSVLVTLVGVSTHVLPPDTVADPQRELMWPTLVRAFTQGAALTPNLGDALGLRGPLALAPLALVWILVAAAWVWGGRREGKRWEPRRPAR